MFEQNDFSYDHMSDREVLISVAKDVKMQGKIADDHEERIKKIEDTKVYATGVVAGLGILGFGWVAKLHMLVQKIGEKFPGVH